MQLRLTAYSMQACWPGLRTGSCIGRWSTQNSLAAVATLKKQVKHRYLIRLMPAMIHTQPQAHFIALSTRHHEATDAFYTTPTPAPVRFIPISVFIQYLFPIDLIPIPLHYNGQTHSLGQQPLLPPQPPHTSLKETVWLLEGCEQPSSKGGEARGRESTEWKKPAKQRLRSQNEREL